MEVLRHPWQAVFADDNFASCENLGRCTIVILQKESSALCSWQQKQIHKKAMFCKSVIYRIVYLCKAIEMAERTFYKLVGDKLV